MRFYDLQIVLQEVPGEVSLCFNITGCEIHCEGCHSPYLWKKGSGKLLSEDLYMKTLIKYQGFASCVLFMGGEWHKEELAEYLVIAKDLGYKTCLYTGENNVEEELLVGLDWVKTGKWESELGGLDSEQTNQKFRDVKTNKILNHLFIKPLSND